MQLSDLIGKLNVAKVVGNDCIEITSVEADSRRVAEGSLFVAVRAFRSTDILLSRKPKRRELRLWCVRNYPTSCRLG